MNPFTEEGGKEGGGGKLNCTHQVLQLHAMSLELLEGPTAVHADDAASLQRDSVKRGQHPPFRVTAYRVASGKRAMMRGGAEREKVRHKTRTTGNMVG